MARASEENAPLAEKDLDYVVSESQIVSQVKIIGHFSGNFCSLFKGKNHINYLKLNFRLLIK